MAKREYEGIEIEGELTRLSSRNNNGYIPFAKSFLHAQSSLHLPLHMCIDDCCECLHYDLLMID
jgi:hypothetical protein